MVTGRYFLGILYGENRRKTENWAMLTHRSSANLRLTKKLIRPRKLPGPWTTTWSNSISLQCIPWPVGCSEWGACLTPSKFVVLGQMTPEWKLLINFCQNLRFNLVMAKFGENWPLRSCRKVISYCWQKTRHQWYFSAPISPPLNRSHPKFCERCQPFSCACVLTLVRIGCSLPDLFRKESKKVNTI